MTCQVFNLDGSISEYVPKVTVDTCVIDRQNKLNQFKEIVCEEFGLAIDGESIIRLDLSGWFTKKFKIIDTHYWDIKWDVYGDIELAKKIASRFADLFNQNIQINHCSSVNRQYYSYAGD